MFFNDSRHTDKLLDYLFNPKYHQSTWKTSPMEIWQKCPVCHGVQPEHELKKCKTCEGSGIIHTLSGKPPKK